MEMTATPQLFSRVATKYLATTIIGAALFMIIRSYTLVQSVGYGFGASFQAARDGGIVAYTLP